MAGHAKHCGHNLPRVKGKRLREAEKGWSFRSVGFSTHMKLGRTG